MRYLLLLFVLYTAPLSAQEFLEIDLSKHCSFDGVVEEELFSFDTEVMVMERFVADIIDWGGVGSKNFGLIQCNVPNFTAVMADGKRYILWSQDFLEKAARQEAIAALAHEVGHHLNLHSLELENIESEELEADYYMGFVLSRAAIPKQLMLDYLSKTLAYQGKNAQKRRESALNGYEQSEIGIMGKSLGWNENNEEIMRFRKKAFNFPGCYQETEIDVKPFMHCKDLGDVAHTILNELQANGYSNKSFLSVPKGFALISRMEQYEENGKSVSAPNRWKDTPIPLNFEFSLNYFKNLFLPRGCNLRIFVFVVTSDIFGPQKQYANKTEAQAWIDQAINGLPKVIATEPYTRDYKIHALVYEFKVPDTDNQARHLCPPKQMDAAQHLKGAGLFD